MKFCSSLMFPASNDDKAPPSPLQESSQSACSCAPRICPRNDAPKAGCHPPAPAAVESELGKRLAENKDPREIVSLPPSAPGPGWLPPPAAHRLEWCGCFPGARTLGPAAPAAAWTAAPTQCLLLRRETASPHGPVQSAPSSAPPLR